MLCPVFHQKLLLKNYQEWFHHFYFTLALTSLDKFLTLLDIVPAPNAYAKAGKWNTELTLSSLNITTPICLCLGHSLEIHAFRPTSPCLIIKDLSPEQNFFNHLVTVLWSTLSSPFIQQILLVVSVAYEPIQTCKV